jgi:hypothetical protein
MNRLTRYIAAVSLCLLMLQAGTAIVPGYAATHSATPPIVLCLPLPYRGTHGRTH